MVSPFVLPLYAIVRRRLRAISQGRAPIALLDVGGRKSHYTIGLDARVTITDLPRQTDVQYALNLGLTTNMSRQLLARRSNLEAVIFDDMTQSTLPDATFDCVVAVEVLEHVEADEAFVGNVARVLKPGGVFLMTTPNGDSVPNSNPDHKRHYTAAGLRALLSRHFADVTVEYAIAAGRCRAVGLHPLSARHPVRSVTAMMANAINRWQSARPEIPQRAQRTRHLIATARIPVDSTCERSA
jgi:SAM-dependent methyltransferase